MLKFSEVPSPILTPNQHYLRARLITPEWDFTTMSGTINTVRDWEGSPPYQLSASGLALPQDFNTTNTGAVTPLPEGTKRVAALVSGIMILKAFFDIGTGKAAGAWFFGSPRTLDGGYIQGSTVHTPAYGGAYNADGLRYFPSSDPAWLELERTGDRYALRAWNTTESRPLTPLVTFASDGAPATHVAMVSVQGTAYVQRLVFT